MDSQMAARLGLKYRPVALLWSDDAPGNAMRFRPGRWGCVMAALAAVADKGRTFVFDRDTYGCPGGGVGLGFGNCYQQFLGGEDGFCGFLSSGNANRPEAGAAMELANRYLHGEMKEEFAHGEGYRKNPAAVREFIDALPITDVPARYVILKPLEAVEPDERPVAITFLVNPDQLSAMTILANYDAGDGMRVIMPHGAACQNVGIYAYQEAKSGHPRAIAGLNDISARKNIRRLGRDLMTMTLPMALYEQMEANVAGSFLDRPTWRYLQEH